MQWSLLFVAGLSSLSAQDFQPHFYHYSTEDGLPSSEVYCSYQDTAGYIWFGTDNGVARFDGYEFVVFDNNDGLEDVVVFSIREDAEGTLWVSTYSGKMFSWDGVQFQAFEHNRRLETWKAENSIIKLVDADFKGDFLFSVKWRGFMHLSREGDIEFLVELSEQGACLYNKKGKGEYGNVNEISSSVTSYSSPDSDFEESLFDYDAQTDSWKHILSTSRKGWVYRRFFNLYDTEETLMFSRDGLYYYKENDLISMLPLKTNTINYLIQFQEEGVFICLNGGRGIKYIRGWDDEDDFVINGLLEGQSISSINFDRAGGMWVSSLEEGVFYASSLESSIYYQYGDRDGGKPLTLSAVDAESIVVCFRDGTTMYFNTEKNEWKLALDKGAANFEMYYDADRKEIYTGDYNIIINDDTTFQVKKPVQRKERLHSIEMRSKYFQFNEINGESRLYFGADAYFGSYDVVNREIVDYYHTSAGGQGQLTIRSYLVDNEGRHWLGTLHGLYEYLPDEQKVVAENLGIEALSQRVQEIRLLDSGALIFGTRGNGLIYYNQDTSFAITTQESLASDMIRDLLVAEDGAIWVATLTGLSKIQFFHKSLSPPYAYQLRTFGTAHGLPNEEIYDIDSFGEDIWLVTSNGIVKFVEPPIEAYSKPPSFSRISVNDQRISAETLEGLSAGDYHLNLKFNTINFCQLGQINYRYRLQADADWIVTLQTEVSFPNLQAGTYQFEVQSQNSDGFWSNSLLLPILIQFPWYKRWWAVVLFIAGGLVSLYSIYRTRVYRLKKDQQILQQIHQLERSALQAQMNPHFVFNSLTSIQNFILAQDTDSAVDYLAQFARLIRNTLNVSLVGQHSLEQELNMLKDYFELEKLRFREGFDYTIEIAEGVDPENIFLPPLLIQPFVENAVKHGLEQDLQGGQVWLDFSEDAEQLLVKISDNGRGFDLRKSKKDSSLGMHITQRRLELMQKYPTNLPPMSIALRYDEGGQVTGTEVTISIQITPFTEISENK